MQATKRLYKFGNLMAEGNKSMKPLLGGKGANLAEMCNIGIPVPAGFTITTEVCIEYNLLGKEETIKILTPELLKGIHHIETLMGAVFNSAENPLLLSVRSGARDSMPGMMDTVLNVGMNDEVAKTIGLKTGNERFAWDSYRRFIQMYGDKVMKINQHQNDNGCLFEKLIHQLKIQKNIISDQDFSTDDLKELVHQFKLLIKNQTNKEFPTDPWTQLWSSIMAVFESWHTPRAIYYREIHQIPNDWGTAVNIQAMVFGNMGNSSGSGVAFTRDAATGAKEFNGEYLINAQGEDVVAGVRTPLQITKSSAVNWAKLALISEDERKNKYPSLEEIMPKVFAELNEIQQKLEHHFKDMQDLEFTIQEGKLWLLQTRNGKRTGTSMIKIGMDMLQEGLIDEDTCLLRMNPHKLDELLHPIFDPTSMLKAIMITRGLPASPGAASGQITFFPDKAEQYFDENKAAILVRTETSADDLKGMHKSVGILTARGGMTSHAAVVARGMGKCCISGAGALNIDYNKNSMSVNGKIFKEGDWISLDGSSGIVYEGKIATINPAVSGTFEDLLQMADHHARMKVRTNADTPESAKIAREFGAQGIGLCRTEHMFFEGDRIKAMREMIIANDETERRKALQKLLPMQRQDFEGIFTEMHDLPVTIRLLDPPLHEFVPYEHENQQELANEMGISLAEVQHKINNLKEINPMLGHRGCRLGNTFPEISQMQARAIIEAAIHLKQQGIRAIPEIMVPLTGTVEEMKLQEEIIKKEIELVFEEKNYRINYTIGTMIEIPRACVVADEIAKHADFFSFGTNDLTQMTFGYSRDDAGKFLPIYLEKGILKHDPFAVLDQEGVGQLIAMGVKKGKATKSGLKIGICGEHGGEPSSIEFCHQVGMDYVSCSPFRVPIARLAAAQAAI
ncbi:MAG: pyruvate, phosphate dikinase, partial [Flavobacteriaceae bacterium]|nr:pyruvate, phosphate dikinase [Flavobacteriaceae bacterium]